MDESIVAVHMIESSDGTYVTTEVIQEEEDYNNTGVGDEIISANDQINELNEIEDNEQYNEEEEEDEDMKQQLEEQMEEMDETVEEQNDEVLDSTEADDIIIAEAVVVTQYSCKFCNRRFDTIDKVKNHYLLRHNKDQSLIDRFSQKTGAETNDKSDEQISGNEKESQQQSNVVKKKIKPVVTNVSKSKTKEYNLRVVSNIKADDGILKKKRGRKPTGVQRKYPCDWPGCNYVARHSVSSNQLIDPFKSQFRRVTCIFRFISKIISVHTPERSRIAVIGRIVASVSFKDQL